MREKIIWIIGGAVFVSLAFLIPWESRGIWPSVLAGTVAAVVFVIAFAWRWVPEIASKEKRVSLYAGLAILLISLSVFTYSQYSISKLQGHILNTYRPSIEKVKAKAYVREPLLKTLRDFYQANEENEPIGEVFRNKYDSLITDGDLYHYPHYEKKNLLQIHVSKLTADSVVLVGEVRLTEGNDKAFANISGEEGYFQTKGILTKEGIRYEREN